MPTPMRPEAVLNGNDHTEGAFPGMAGVKVETTAEGRSLNALYRHPQRTRLDTMPSAPLHGKGPCGSGERWGFYEPTRDDGARP